VALKIRHNAVLGYFVETTAKAAEPLMTAPLNATFIHRQTLANQVRFTTVELAELDARIAQAAERALAIEVETFEAWREAAHRRHGRRDPGRRRGRPPLDVAAASAEWAEDAGASRRIVDRSTAFEAEAARHPVVEAAVRRAGEPSPPTTAASTGRRGGARLSIVTGPNMAGKSTFLRQNALLAVLAQAGSSCRPSACASASSTACSAASAPATTWRAAARPSWPRWSRPPRS
jgi:DNA mismatch repair protein MutS